MGWTSTLRFYFTGLLLALGLLLGGPSCSLAQANQGLVPDSTEARVLHEFYLATGGDQWGSRLGWPTSGAWPAAPTSADFATWQGGGGSNGNGNVIYPQLPADSAAAKPVALPYVRLWVPQVALTAS